MASRGKTLFNSVKLRKPNRSTFNLSHDVKMSGKMGYLYPTLAAEVIPGDKFTIGTDALVRFAPLLAPVMHRFNFFQHYFFVPNRLVWQGWENFITNTADPVVPELPYITIQNSTQPANKQFLDYFGIECPTTGSVNVNALPFAAYQRIYNEYYRDQNLQTEIPDTDLVDGSNTTSVDNLCSLRTRNLEHDYFTSALPFAQKGAPVDIPLGDVILKPGIIEEWDGTGQKLWQDVGVGNPLQPMPDENTVQAFNGYMDSVQDSRMALLDPNGTMTTTPTTINDLRRAFRLQEWLERNALGGTRYIEHILAHFGVKSSDARLQRPEYITGTKVPIIVSEVLNTTGVTDFYNGDDSEVQPTGSPQATMAGHGVASQQAQHVGSYFAEEHGYIIGIMSVMPKTAYQQGIPRHFLKDSFLDFAFPEFANLGEQAVYDAEIYANAVEKKHTFGYVPRYSEYKFMQSRVAGEFKTSLDYWHAGRIFDSEPALNSDLIRCEPSDYSRIFAVENGADHLYIQIVHKILASRLLPFYGTPTI